MVIRVGSRSFWRGGFPRGGEWGGNHKDIEHLRGERGYPLRGPGLGHGSGALYISNFNLTITQRGVGSATTTPAPNPGGKWGLREIQ